MALSLTTPFIPTTRIPSLSCSSIATAIKFQPPQKLEAGRWSCRKEGIHPEFHEDAKVYCNGELVMTDPLHLDPPSLYESNTRLKLLAKSGQLPAARHLFDQMPHRDEITYTTLISGYARLPDSFSAVSLFSRMRRDPSLSLDPFLLSLTIKSCAPSHLPTARSLHSLAVKSGHLSSVFVSTSLLDSYSRCGAHSHALHVFDEIPRPNAVTWTSGVTALVRAVRPSAALRCFAAAVESSATLDSHTYAIALKAAADASLPSRAREIHCHVIKRGLESPSYVANALSSAYFKSGDLRTGLQIFDRMRVPDVVAWTNVVTAYSQLGRQNDAIVAFLRMREDFHVSPNAYTYAAVISACTGLVQVTWGEQLHGHVTRAGFAAAPSVSNALVTLYSRAGRLASASLVFRENNVVDTVSWSAIIAAHSQEGHVVESFALFSRMRDSGTRPNEFTLASLLSACASGAAMGPGRQVHGYVMTVGLESEGMIVSALISMYSKCGAIDDAEQIFEEREPTDPVSWTAMLNGYAEHGRSRAAIRMFERMKMEGMDTDHVAYIGVLSACRHAGMVEEGIEYLGEMEQVGGLRLGREHYGCVADLLARAGRAEEAEMVVARMAGMADEVAWTAVMRAWGERGEEERGRRAAASVMEREPRCGGAHVAMANLYAGKERWGEAAEMRKAMRGLGVRKEVGWSSVEDAGGVAVFVAGDRTNERSVEVYQVLELVYFEARGLEELDGGLELGSG